MFKKETLPKIYNGYRRKSCLYQPKFPINTEYLIR